MNMAEDTSSWQSAARAAEECQYLNQLYDKEDLKVIFLTEYQKAWGPICRQIGEGPNLPGPDLPRTKSGAGEEIMEGPVDGPL